MIEFDDSQDRDGIDQLLDEIEDSAPYWLGVDHPETAPCPSCARLHEGSCE